jgi:hypothetical protein
MQQTERGNGRLWLCIAVRSIYIYGICTSMTRPERTNLHQDINQSIYNTHSPRPNVLTRHLHKHRQAPNRQGQRQAGKASAFNRANRTLHNGLSHTVSGCRGLHTAHRTTPEYTSRVRAGAAHVNTIDNVLHQSMPTPSWCPQSQGV